MRGVRRLRNEKRGDGLVDVERCCATIRMEYLVDVSAMVSKVM
jgi:hypothetical protein